MKETTPKPLVRPRGAAWAWALMALLVGLGFTAWGGIEAWNTQQRADQQRLERHAQRIVRILNSRFSGYEDLLRSTRSFCRRNPQPTAEAWRQFAEDLDFLNRHPGVKTLAYVARVRHEDLPAFLARHQADGSFQALCDVKSLDASDRSLLGERDHLVIIHAEPLANVSKAMGMDVGTSFHQRRAADLAGQTGQPAMTGPLQFRSGGVPQPAVAIFYPVAWDPGSAGAEAMAWVSLGLYLESFFEDVKQGGDEGIATEIFDLTGGDGVRLDPLSGPAFEAIPGPVRRQRLEAFGRTWGLAFRPLPAFFQTGQRLRPVLILLTGGIASLSLAGAVWSLASARNRAHHLAEHLTHGLRAVVRRLDMLIESTPVAVIEWDARMKVRRWNPAAGQIFGFEAEEVLDRSGSGLRTPGHPAEAARSSLEEVFREARSSSRTLEVVRKDGQAMVCEWISSPLYDEEGRVEGVLSIVLDVTERRRAEERVWLQQKLESLGVMAGGIAHDFNNLLWAISGNAELARNRVPEGSPALENLQRIETAAFRAADLARQMLAYSGQAPFSIRSIDLAESMEGLKKLARATIPRSVALDFQIQPGLPRINADEVHLQQAITNLLTNAAEAMGEKPGRIRVEVYALEASPGLLLALAPGSSLGEGPAVCISVRDEGIGMDSDTQAKVFDPFFSTKATGRGLGLSATLGILRALGGGLRLESQPGEGTTVRMYLPAALAVPPVPESEPPARISGQGGWILLAEDEDVLRDLTVEALEPAGYRVLAASDGLEALEIFEARAAEIALVVMDLNMPRMGGVEAFRRIRALDPGVKVILCSGFAEEEIHELGPDLRPDGFLHKPYRLRELVRMVRELVA